MPQTIADLVGKNKYNIVLCDSPFIFKSKIQIWSEDFLSPDPKKPGRQLLYSVEWDYSTPIRTGKISEGAVPAYLKEFIECVLVNAPNQEYAWETFSELSKLSGKF